MPDIKGELLAETYQQVFNEQSNTQMQTLTLTMSPPNNETNRISMVGSVFTILLKINKKIK